MKIAKKTSRSKYCYQKGKSMDLKQNSSLQVSNIPPFSKKTRHLAELLFLTVLTKTSKFGLAGYKSKTATSYSMRCHR